MKEICSVQHAKFGAFINTTVTYTDSIHMYSNAILACTKQQHTEYVHKHTFTLTKET